MFMRNGLENDDIKFISSFYVYSILFSAIECKRNNQFITQFYDYIKPFDSIQFVFQCCHQITSIESKHKPNLALRKFLVLHPFVSMKLVLLKHYVINDDLSETYIKDR